MSATAPIVALAGDAAEAEGAIVLRAPAVGILRGVPAAGRLISAGEPFARLTVLDRSYPLLAPEEVSGVVVEIHVEGTGADAIPVGYAQPILTLEPVSAGVDAPDPPAGGGPPAPGGARRGRTARGEATGAGAGAGSARARGRPVAGAAAEAIPAGCHAVYCPADGIFYRRPKPTEPPYVEPGGRVRTGQTLALIEAMKTFSAIVYGGPSLPTEAEIVEVRAEDAAEVRHGQVLFVVR